MKMFSFLQVLLLLTSLTLVAPAQIAFAQDDGEETVPLRNELPYGIGVQYAAPAFGLSGMYDFTERVSGQAVVGLFGALQVYAARGLYRFKQNQAYDLYGFGTVGIWQYSVASESTSITGFGGGAGLEYSWQQLFENADLPRSTATSRSDSSTSPMTFPATASRPSPTVLAFTTASENQSYPFHFLSSKSKMI